MNGRFDKKALAGCIVMGGLALAAVVVQIGSGDIWPFHRDDTTATDSAPVASSNSTKPPATALDDTSDADIAYVLQAISDNLQRNDLTAAKVLLDEVLAVHADLPQALALQQELRMREAKTKAATAKANQLAATRDAPDTVAQHAVETPARTSHSSATKEMREDMREPARKHERTIRNSHVNTRGPVSVAQRNHTASVSNGRPKTRAEVVAELKQARANGTMPNFGGRHP